MIHLRRALIALWERQGPHSFAAPLSIRDLNHQGVVDAAERVSVQIELVTVGAVLETPHSLQSAAESSR